MLAQKSRVLELQAAGVLNEMYCNMLRKQLAYQEEQKNKSKGKGRLVGDGLPRLLSSDEFYEWVVEFTKVQERDEQEKAARKAARKGREGVMAVWREQDAARKAENTAKRQHYRDAMKAWEEAKLLAKSENRRFMEPKPKMEKVFGAAPKPPLVVEVGGSSDEEGEGENDDENGDDNND